MDKAEIIAKTITQMNRTMVHQPFPDEEDTEFVISVLQDVLPSGDIQTCEDFQHLKVECCDICHGHYAHYEMNIINLPDGRKVWVCHAVKQAIFPKDIEAAQMLSRICRGSDEPEKLLKSTRD